jgi:hypothetical protein
MNQVDQESKSNRDNPRAFANFFSIASFYWTLDIFKKGYKKHLELNDLYKPLNADDSAILGSRLEKYDYYLTIFVQLNNKLRVTLIT